ncbi:MAG TPA: GTPase Era [Steroidobacteraceae bacterium]|nr:GTPase Era [Steroidobacteraceae bacterium]
MNAGDPQRWGTAVLAGRPNVGKSTLLNALAGRKLSIVTPKAQTTRHRIEGEVAGPGFRMILADTPGAGAAAGSRLAHFMNREGEAALDSADVAILVVSAPRWTDGDSAVLERLKRSGLPVVLALNKIDRVKPRAALLPLLDSLAKRHDFAAIVPVSAAMGENLEALAKATAALLPEGPAAEAPPPRGRGERFQAAEALREQLMLALSDELPYGIAVEIERFEPTEDGRTEIDAVIWVERVGQRKIVIGAKGARLKAIATAARLALNEQFGRRVHLNTWVKVREGWSDDDRLLQRLGHDLP